MHDALFGWESALDEYSLGAIAGKAGVDPAALKSCLESGRAARLVRQDYLDGLRAGVDGTPAFFINGILLSGAQPAEAFSEVIDSELKRLGISLAAEDSARPASGH
jgi:protein-disulfide isomerase